MNDALLDALRLALSTSTAQLRDLGRIMADAGHPEAAGKITEGARCIDDAAQLLLADDRPIKRDR